MLLYQFENLQYIEHKQEIEVQRGRSAAADASQRLRELMVSAGTGNHLSAVRFLWR
jgi:RNA-splicing ligase RtcB